MHCDFSTPIGDVSSFKKKTYSFHLLCMWIINREMCLCNTGWQRLRVYGYCMWIHITKRPTSPNILTLSRQQVQTDQFCYKPQPRPPWPRHGLSTVVKTTHLADCSHRFVSTSSVLRVHTAPFVLELPQQLIWSDTIISTSTYWRRCADFSNMSTARSDKYALFCFMHQRPSNCKLQSLFRRFPTHVISRIIITVLICDISLLHGLFHMSNLLSASVV